MAENKKSFIAYADWHHMFKQLPDDVAGKLIKHIFSYVNDENPVSDDYIINALFEQIKSVLKRDLSKWETQRLQRSLAGKKSAEIRSTKINERSTNVNEKERNSTDICNMLYVNVNNNNIDVRKSKFSDSIKPFVDTYGRDMCNQFFSYWSEHGENDKKMRFEKEKSFNLKLRLERWQRNQFNSKSPAPAKKVYAVTPDGIEITDKLVYHTYINTGKI